MNELSSSYAAGRSVWFGLLLNIFLVLIAPIPNSGQTGTGLKSALALLNGDYEEAIAYSRSEIEQYKRLRDVARVSEIYEIHAHASTELGNFEDATSVLTEYLEFLHQEKVSPRFITAFYILFSDVKRSERKYVEALKQVERALNTSGVDQLAKARSELSVGRILFRAGHDASAIVWLQKAEEYFKNQPTSTGKLDTYRFLSLAWSNKMNYPRALDYSDKFVSASANSPYRYKHLLAKYEAATLLSSTGQKQKAIRELERGLQLSNEFRNTYQTRNFLASLLLNHLYVADYPKASRYLTDLSSLDIDNQFAFEKTLGRAVISASNGQTEIAEPLFRDLDEPGTSSDFILPWWRIGIAEKNGNWNEVIRLNKGLLEITLRANYQDDLPRIYMSLAGAHFALGQFTQSREFADKALSLIEQLRRTNNTSLSLGLLETYHKAYRLVTQLKLDRPPDAFASSDYLKARLLRDRIDNSLVKTQPVFSAQRWKRLAELAEQVVANPEKLKEIGNEEKLLTAELPEVRESETKLDGLNEIAELTDTAIISYSFTNDGKLNAFVWEKDKPVRTVVLPVEEAVLEREIISTEKKIKDRVFFKRDGKSLYDKLLKPVGSSARHFVIIPDKFLWKVPFQALSPDGEKYLIEEKLISYAPSAAILLNQLQGPKPNRQTINAFANATFEGKVLRHVDSEAVSVARLFNSKPSLNATTDTFRRVSAAADINHFSMHAQVDGEEPVDSFLAFRATANNKGRLTVEQIQDTKLKKGSVAFLASCDTNNVLSGEGLVSLAWGFMGSGATTVVSAQWEANDRFTGVFARSFYGNYRKGFSSAKALQQSSIDLTRDKATEMHEPYYWANFSVNGDFR